MRYLPLLLLVPLLSAQAAPNCSQLQNIAQKLEADVSKKLLPNCDKLTPQELGQPEKAPGFDDYKCKDYAAIDLQLQSIENEIALLKGIASLKDDIDKGIKTLNAVPDKGIAIAASKHFYKNLKVAASLEDLLRTTNDKGNILNQIVTDKGGWTDKNSFAGLMKKYCADYSSEGTICTGKWELSDDVYKEIDSFLKVGGKTVSKFDKKQVRELARALAVKKGGKDYSFAALLEEIKDPGEGVLSKDSLAILKANDLDLGNDNFNFKEGLLTARKDLNNSSNLIEAQGAPARFQKLIEDLKNREEWQLKSKLSFILNEYDKNIPDDLRSKCDSARNLSSEPSACLDELAKVKTLDNTGKSRVADLAYEMKYGQAHVAKLNDVLAKCVPDNDLKQSPDCSGIISKKVEDLVLRSQALSALKARHLQTAPELMTMRNFVMEKLLSGECMTEGNADISCDQDIGSISKETKVLTEDTGKIITLLDNPKEESKIDDICKDGKETISYKSDICSLMNEEAEEKKVWKRTDYVPPMNSNNGPDHSKEGYLAAGQSILQSIAGYFAPRPQPLVNPYMNNMNPYPIMAQPQDISQKIMTPYMATGYGNYFSTPGLRPYSSINSNVGTFSAYSFSGGSHFNSPVGW